MADGMEHFRFFSGKSCYIYKNIYVGVNEREFSKCCGKVREKNSALRATVPAGNLLLIFFRFTDALELKHLEYIALY